MLQTSISTAVSGIPNRDRDLLRLVTCGSVDDGKSTLIGRLLVETGCVPDDQFANLIVLSRRFGTTGDDPDYALLLDGLEAEREQGITIDVAYRYLGTNQRALIIADTPGHEQYTRNMVTGASNAELAVMLIDARTGLTKQTMRHTRIAALLGIHSVLLVVNKMDLIDFSEKAFGMIEAAYRRFAADLGFSEIVAVPTAARFGDNVAARSARMPWYRGPSVLKYLETTDARRNSATSALRFVVQSAIRAEGEFRGYAGQVLSGRIAKGDEIIVARSGKISRVSRIATFDGDLDFAEAGKAVTLVLADHIDVGRGDLISRRTSVPEVADQFAAHVVWLNEEPLLPGRGYKMQLGTQLVNASVTMIKHGVDIETGAKTAARVLEMNDIGVCNIATMTQVAFDPYAQNPKTGAFILIDRVSGATVGAGMIDFPLRRASNVVRQDYFVGKTSRSHIKGQRPCIVWFTGLPGAGKSTIMNIVEQRLAHLGLHTYALDGDNLRLGLNRDLGFTEADRVENIRRAGEVARLMVDAGLIVLCAFISPFRAERQMIRQQVEPGEFIEIFVETPLSVCMERDPKGLYAKARAGQVVHVTGVDSPYEPPEAPEIRLDTTTASAEVLAERVIDELAKRNVTVRP